MKVWIDEEDDDVDDDEEDDDVDDDEEWSHLLLGNLQ